MIEGNYEAMFGEKREEVPYFLPSMPPPDINRSYIESVMEKAKKEKKWVLAYVIGTKPCFYKFYGSIVESMKADIPFLIIDSNQHYDKILTHGRHEFNYNDKIAINLNIRGGLAQKSAELMLKISWFASYLKDKWPDVTVVPVVLGDTIMTSIVPAAWMFTRSEKAIQNEAGLRSMAPVVMKEATKIGKEISVPEFVDKQINGDWMLLRNEPFPEQWDTFVSAAGSEYMFAPLDLNKKHLVREGHPEENIFVTGGVVVEALEMKRKEKPETSIFNTYPQLEQGEWIRLDIHRRDNLTPRRFKSIIGGVKNLVEKGYNVLFIEMNATKHALNELRLRDEINKMKERKNFLFTEIWPEYAQVIEFFESPHCFGVLTDSGGVQEEMNILNKPCMTVRFNTDRPETVHMAKSNILVPPVDASVVSDMVEYVYNNNDMRKMMTNSPNIYGSDVAKKMIAQVKQLMDSGAKPFKWCHNALNLWNDDVENSFR